MRIYTLRLDSNHYQRFLPEDEGIWKTKTLRLNCTSRLPDWVPPSVYVPNPTLQKGNFFYLAAGAFVTGPTAIEKLRDLLEMAGELLPLRYKGESYTLLNVTECSDCLDHDRTQWVTGKDGTKIRIISHAFNPARLPESSIFKIPERLATIYTVEGRFDPEDEFKFRVEQEKLEGLLFEEVWRSDG